MLVSTLEPASVHASSTSSCVTSVHFGSLAGRTTPARCAHSSHGGLIALSRSVPFSSDIPTPHPLDPSAARSHSLQQPTLPLCSNHPLQPPTLLKVSPLAPTTHAATRSQCPKTTSLPSSISPATPSQHPPSPAPSSQRPAARPARNEMKTIDVTVKTLPPCGERRKTSATARRCRTQFELTLPRGIPRHARPGHTERTRSLVTGGGTRSGRDETGDGSWAHARTGQNFLPSCLDSISHRGSEIT